MFVKTESAVIHQAVKDVGGDEELEEILRIYLQIEPEIRRPFVRRLLEVVQGVDWKQEPKQEERPMDEEEKAREDFELYHDALKKKEKLEQQASSANV